MRGSGALRKIALGALGLYLLAVAGFTLYAQTGYVDSLPTAYLTRPGPGEISFTLAETGTVEDGKLHYSHQLGKGLPNDVIVPGLKAQYTGEDGQRGEGEVLSIASGIQGLSGAEIWLSLPEGLFREGEQVAFQVEERTITFRDAIPRQAVQERENGDPVVYVIEESEGPWGRRYQLQARSCGSVWPYNDPDSAYVMVSASLRQSGQPIVVDVEGGLFFDGLEVRLAAAQISEQ